MEDEAEKCSISEQSMHIITKGTDSTEHEFREGSFHIGDNRVPNKSNLISRTWKSSTPQMAGTNRLSVGLITDRSQNLKYPIQRKDVGNTSLQTDVKK